MSNSLSRSALRLRVLVVAVAVCTVLYPTGAAVADPGDPQIHGVAPRVVSEGRAQSQGKLDPQQRLRVTVVLQPPRQDELQRFLDEVTDPSSPGFHRFLSFDEWKARFAPSDQQVDAVRSWVQADGLSSVHRFGNNLALKVEGTAATIERTFDVQLNQYRFGSRRFFSTDRDPTIPRRFAGLVKDVRGLDSYHRVSAVGQPLSPASDDEPIYRPGPFRKAEASTRSAGVDPPGGKAQPQICCGGSSGIEAPDLFRSEAYDLTALQRLSRCCNPTHNPGGSPRETSIAIIGQNKINPNDLAQFAGQYGMAVNLTQHELNGPACCNDEMTLDIESATAMANSFGSYLDTAHVHAYEGGGTLLSDLLDAWEEAHSDDQARNASTSFGAFEDQFGGLFTPSISDFTDVINAMAAEGWSIAAASGDHGAYDDCENLSVHFPASSPNVVAIGGTALTLNNNSGQPQYASEVSWTGNGCGGSDWPGSNNGGGGGGCSDVEPKGWWQSRTVGCGDKRALPDISLNAGTGQAIYYGGWKRFGGTSIGAPEFAGFLAQENSYLLTLGNICTYTRDKPCAPLGNPDTAIWFEGGLNSTNGLRNPFYDITSGCNGGSQGQGYCTTPSYDLATGWGSVNMFQLAWVINEFLLSGHPTPAITFAGSAPNQWYNGDQSIGFSVVSPPFTGTSASVGIAGHTAQWDAPVAEVQTHATPGSGDVFYDGPKTLATTGSLSLAAAGLGCHTAHVRAWDNAGYASSDKTYGPVCYDNQPPDVYCGAADGVWHATDASITCYAFDQSGLSGLANPADSSFTLTTSVPAATETTDAYTNSHQVCDNAGNCVTAGPVGANMVDKKAPSISITAPTATQYIVHQSVAASYSCADGGSGVATCAGPVASGSPFDTSTVGTKIFTVNATDKVGNASNQPVSYNVTYKICLLYDPTTPSGGRGYTIKLQLCDNNNVNLSNSSIVLTATAVDGDPAKAKPLGNLNPGNKFLYGPGTAPGASYLYLLDTLGLTTGTHSLSFTVQGDPIVHTAPFVIK
jgi:Pro-kumamolisin, activation domain